MNTIVSNPNLIKLKELSDKLCTISENETKNEESVVLVEEIKKTIDIESKNINSTVTKEEKLNCYEKMFQKLQIIINNFKI